MEVRVLSSALFKCDESSQTTRNFRAHPPRLLVCVVLLVTVDDSPDGGKQRLPFSQELLRVFRALAIEVIDHFRFRDLFGGILGHLLQDTLGKIDCWFMRHKARGLPEDGATFARMEINQISGNLNQPPARSVSHPCIMVSMMRLVDSALVFGLGLCPEDIANEYHRTTKGRHAEEENPAQDEHHHALYLRRITVISKLIVTIKLQIDGKSVTISQKKPHKGNNSFFFWSSQSVHGYLLDAEKEASTSHFPRRCWLGMG